MKHAEYLVLGLAAVAVLLIVKQSKSSGASAGTGATTSSGGGWVSEIFNGVSSWGNGWRYFSDGTAIDPQGRYYLNGQLVWSPA